MYNRVSVRWRKCWRTRARTQGTPHALKLMEHALGVSHARTCRVVRRSFRTSAQLQRGESQLPGIYSKLCTARTKREFNIVIAAQRPRTPDTLALNPQRAVLYVSTSTKMTAVRTPWSRTRERNWPHSTSAVSECTQAGRQRCLQQGVAVLIPLRYRASRARDMCVQVHRRAEPTAAEGWHLMTTIHWTDTSTVGCRTSASPLSVRLITSNCLSASYDTTSPATHRRTLAKKRLLPWSTKNLARQSFSHALSFLNQPE